MTCQWQNQAGARAPRPHSSYTWTFYRYTVLQAWASGPPIVSAEPSGSLAPSLNPPNCSFPRVYPSALSMGTGFHQRPCASLLPPAVPSALACLLRSLSNLLIPSGHISQLPSMFPHLSLHPKSTPGPASHVQWPRESGLDHCCRFGPHISLPNLCSHPYLSPGPAACSASSHCPVERHGICLQLLLIRSSQTE